MKIINDTMKRLKCIKLKLFLRSQKSFLKLFLIQDSLSQMIVLTFRKQKLENGPHDRLVKGS